MQALLTKKTKPEPVKAAPLQLAQTSSSSEVESFAKAL
jgi:hypothetical protein